MITTQKIDISFTDGIKQHKTTYLIIYFMNLENLSKKMVKTL